MKIPYGTLVDMCALDIAKNIVNNHPEPVGEIPIVVRRKSS